MKHLGTRLSHFMVSTCARTSTRSLNCFCAILTGTSFITDGTGDVVASADRSSEQILYADFDLDRCRAERTAWGIFRDRRTDLYRPLLTKDGTHPQGV